MSANKTMKIQDDSSEKEEQATYEEPGAQAAPSAIWRAPPPVDSRDVVKRLDDRPGTSQTSPASAPGTSQTSPASAPGTSQTSPASASGNTVRDIQAVKSAEYDITQRDDEINFWITGLSITPDGRRLLADFVNSKIKMFSRDMKIISSLTLPARPWNIAVTGDREAVVSVVNQFQLFILDVSDKQMSIRRTVELSFGVRGIVAHKDKLVVTSVDPPYSVQLIDHSGNVYWSTSTKKQGQQLFSQPWYVTCYDDGRSSTVIVSDGGMETLTVLNSDTGDVLRRCEVGDWKGPRSVTTDPAGNVYVCYSWTPEVAVWSRDLTEEKILLTLPHSGLWPGSVPVLAYDSVEDELLVIQEIEDQ